MSEKIKKERFSQVSDSLAEKARACKTHEEFESLLQESGIELTESQMDLIAGGSCNPFCDYDCLSHCQGTCETCGKNC